MERSIPTPSVEDYYINNMKSNTAAAAARRNNSSGTKSASKPAHRVTKRAVPQHNSRSPASDHSPLSPHSGSLDSRHKRVWKACERCRMKKTKCDGEFPCKRCKDDGLVCTAGTRKKTEYKQLPRGYAEVLEHTQFALIATVHKLYSMVRNGQQWDLGEPDLNDRGQPIIHNIATKLGCIRPNADADLPPHSVFPEDEPGMAQLAAELEAQQQERERERVLEEQFLPQTSTQEYAAAGGPESCEDSSCNRTDRASSSEIDHSDFEQDYRKAFLNAQDIQSLSPQGMKPYNDFEPTNTSKLGLGIQHESLFPVTTQHQQQQQQSESPPPPYTASVWNNAAPARSSSLSSSTSLGPHQHQQQQPQYMAQQQPMDAVMADLMLSQGLLESEFGTIKPHILCGPNSDAMLGLGDPMIFSGYAGMESLRS